MERTTQTEPPKAPKWKQIWLCFLGDDKFRKQRQREATEKCGKDNEIWGTFTKDVCIFIENYEPSTPIYIQKIKLFWTFPWQLFSRFLHVSRD